MGAPQDVLAQELRRVQGHPAVDIHALLARTAGRRVWPRVAHELRRRLRYRELCTRARATAARARPLPLLTDLRGGAQGCRFCVMSYGLGSDKMTAEMERALRDMQAVMHLKKK